MRGGIPDEIWVSVITIYKDGEIIQKFTGNDNPRNTRVFLIDERGTVIFFHDSGFSINALNELISTLKINSISPTRNINISRNIIPNSYRNRLYFISNMSDKVCRTLRKNRDLQKLHNYIENK